MTQPPDIDDRLAVVQASKQAELIEHLQSLAKGVGLAEELYNKGQITKDSKLIRASMSEVLKHTNIFISATMQGKLSLPISALRSALEALQKGYTTPFLKPVNYGNRPPLDAFSNSIKGVAAAALEVGMKSGLTLDAASKKVASTLSATDYCLSKKGDKPKPSTIRDWRSMVKREQAQKPTIEKYQFEILLEQVNARPEQKSKEFYTRQFQEILNTMQDTVRTMWFGWNSD